MEKKFEDLITKYIIIEFPIKRIKCDGKFKRAMVFNGIPYIMNHLINRRPMIDKISLELSLVFGCTKEEAINLTEKTLNW